MPRLWRIFGFLAPLLVLYLSLRSSESYASPYRPWFLATYPKAGTTAEFYEPQDQKPFHQQGDSQPVIEHPVLGLHEDPVDNSAFVRRIVAVGDLHGDIGNARKVLQMAGVVNENGDWTGNVDFFVQTGDIIDRGDDTIQLYSLMDKLRDQALAAGDTVVTHLGNHEWMNVIGDWRYVYPSEIDTFGSVDARSNMLTTGRIGEAWATNYTTTSRLPLHPSMGPLNTDYDPTLSSPLSHAALSFVHGGLAPTYPNLTPYPSAINNISATLLNKLRKREFPPPHPPNPYPGLPQDATAEEARLYGSDGPLWYRGWALDTDEGVAGGLCDRADDVMKRVGVRRMIMGHTPDFERIVSRCDGKIIIIDTGISHAYGGALSALSITYSLTPVSSDSGEKSWKEKEVVVAVYEGRQEVLAIDERVIAGPL